MTVASTTRAAGPFNCNGSLVDFDFDFKVFSEDDVRVVLTDDDGVESVLTLTNDYTVALNADQENNPGGTVTTGATYAAGNTITIDGALAYEQQTELTNRGGFFPKVIERSLDRLTILTQQLKKLADRSLKQPVSDTAAIGELPTKGNRASKFLFFNADGDPTAAAGTSTDDGLRADLASAGEASGGALVEYKQFAGASYTDSIQASLRARSAINLWDEISPTKKTALAAGSRINVDAEVDAIKGQGKTILWPTGKFGLAVSHEFAVSILGAGRSATLGTNIELTGTGRIVMTAEGTIAQGFYVASPTASLVFIELQAQGIQLDWITLQCGLPTSATLAECHALTQVAVEITTGSMAFPAAVNGLRLTRIKFWQVHTAVKTTGTAYCNGNVFGTADTNWAGLARTFDITNTNGFGANEIAGYNENSTTVSIVFSVAAGASVQYNRIGLWLDHGGASMAAFAGSGTVNENFWPMVNPADYDEVLTVSRPQSFGLKYQARAFVPTDVTGLANGAFVKVPFTSETYDTFGIYDHSGDVRVEIPRAMYARIRSAVKAGGNIAAGNPMFISVFLNGISVASDERYAEGTSAETLSVECKLLCAAGDTIEVHIRLDGSGTHTVTGGTAFSWIEVEEV
jgi:hypothetical protein